MFVANGGNHRIEVFTYEGDFSRKIESKSVIIQDPCGLAFDKAGNLIVSDFEPSGTVHVFDRSGQYIKSFDASNGSLERAS